MEATERPWEARPTQGAYAKIISVGAYPTREVALVQVDRGAMVRNHHRDENNANADLIVKAVNMHEKFVAFAETMKKDCEKRQDTGSCEGCFGTMPGGIPCDIRALLKEARGDK